LTLPEKPSTLRARVGPPLMTPSLNYVHIYVYIPLFTGQCSYSQVDRACREAPRAEKRRIAKEAATKSLDREQSLARAPLFIARVV